MREVSLDQVYAVMGMTHVENTCNRAEIAQLKAQLKEAQDSGSVLLEEYQKLSADHDAALAKIKTLEATPPPTEAS